MKDRKEVIAAETAVRGTQLVGALHSILETITEWLSGVKEKAVCMITGSAGRMAGQS